MEERIKEIIEEMSTEDKVALWNEYCDSANRTDDWIYSMEEFDEIMNGREPWDIVRTCYFGDFNPTHEYFGSTVMLILKVIMILTEKNHRSILTNWLIISLRTKKILETMILQKF